MLSLIGVSRRVGWGWRGVEKNPFSWGRCRYFQNVHIATSLRSVGKLWPRSESWSLYHMQVFFLFLFLIKEDFLLVFHFFSHHGKTTLLHGVSAVLGADSSNSI